MAIITKIEAQKKNNDRVNIYINDEFFMSVFTELVYTFNLKKGMTIDRENLKSILDNDMYIKAKLFLEKVVDKVKNIKYTIINFINKIKHGKKVFFWFIFWLMNEVSMG